MTRLASVGIFLHDLPRAVAFYEKAFGFATQRDFGTYVLLAGEDPASSLILSALPDDRSADDVGRSIMKLVFFVDDAAAALTQLAAAGGTVVEPATPRKDLPYTIGFGRDPDGHLLEIIADRGRSKAPLRRSSPVTWSCRERFAPSTPRPAWRAQREGRAARRRGRCGSGSRRGRTCHRASARLPVR